MKAITICQPWAWAIIHGPKRYENRTWPASYRGPLLIHAGKSRAWLEGEEPGDWPTLYGIPFDWPTLYGIPFPGRGELVFGAIIGLVDLVDVVQPAQAGGDPFAEGPWCWRLENPRTVEPIPWRGSLSFFEVPDELVRQATSRLTAQHGLVKPAGALPAGPLFARAS
jgi:hypothetical protein